MHGGNPANSGRSLQTIATERLVPVPAPFYNVGGVLAVELTVRPLSAATPLASWTLSDPSDTIGSTVGGNRYGWLLNNTQPLALDNITRSASSSDLQDGCYEQGIDDGSVVNPGTGYAQPLPLSGCEIGVYFDQAGSVKNADLAGATHYGVFADKGAKVDVTGSQIHRSATARSTASRSAAPCSTPTARPER